MSGRPPDDDPWKRPLTPPTAPPAADDDDLEDDDLEDDDEYYEDDDWEDDDEDDDWEDDNWEDEERPLPSLKRALTAAGTGVALAALAIMAIVFALVMFIRLFD